jgi:hypothetical protein
VSSGSALFIIYAKYGCIHVSSIIVTSSGSVVLPVPGLPAPEPVVGCWLGSHVVEVLLCFINLSMISSQKTPGGIGRLY